MDRREKLTANLADKKARKIILGKIAVSTDETLGKGKFWRSASYMHEFGFTDLMDILLYYLSLQPDLSTFVAKIKVDIFLWKTVRAHWQKRARELFPFIRRSPWASGPGWAGSETSNRSVSGPSRSIRCSRSRSMSSGKEAVSIALNS